MLRRRSPVAPKAKPYVPPEPGADQFAEEYPRLTEFLAAEAFEDGGKREPGTLGLSFSDGRFRGALNDKEAGEYAFLSSDTMAGLLDALEGGLASDSIEWRKSKPFTGKRT